LVLRSPLLPSAAEEDICSAVVRQFDKLQQTVVVTLSFPAEAQHWTDRSPEKNKKSKKTRKRGRKIEYENLYCSAENYARILSSVHLIGEQ
jgi:hypothetical protein